MKLKCDFVTNSSSVSYIISVYKIKDSNKIQEFLKEEFGKLGERLFKNCIITSSDLIKKMDLDNIDRLPYDEYGTKVEDFKNKLLSCSEVLYSQSDLYANVIQSLPNNEIIESIYNHSYAGYDG